MVTNDGGRKRKRSPDIRESLGKAEIHDSGDPIFPVRREVTASNTGSPENMELARMWVRDCLDNHDTCKAGHLSGSRGFLPTRLIDVREPECPFLQTTRDAPVIPAGVEYLALSYAWGSGKRFTTTKENIKSHGERIPTGNLPRTFADAFEVTRLLGYRYIWVDAFCITQNDDDDKSRELPHMGDIYRYAVFTIFAEGAPNAHAGLFQARHPYVYWPCVVDIRTTMEHDVTSETLTLATSCMGHNYLKPRGWILQEEVLTSKGLIFGKQMSWKCTVSEASETEPYPRFRRNGLAGSQEMGEDTLRHWIYVSDKMRDSQTSSGLRWNHYDAWYTMVVAYSSRELSFDSDRLPALSGLANLFQRAYNSTYVAGLWKEDLKAGLAWYVANNDPRPPKKDRGCEPSWSWISVGMARLRSQSRIMNRYGPDFDAEIVDASCKLKDELNPYGQVKEGMLKLRSRIKRAILRYSSKYVMERTECSFGSYSGPNSATMTRGEHPRFPALAYDAETSEIIGEVALDTPIGTCLEPNINRDYFWGDSDKESYSSSEREVWCAVLHVQKATGLFRGNALVLEKSLKDSLRYHRVGLVFLNEDRLENRPLSSWELETLEII